ncbi:MAG: DUF1573 domain-containing protein [Bacteroidales bacterium]|nr:DUF1573 domain-containing protein [Bacteroidales bacterium]
MKKVLLMTAIAMLLTTVFSTDTFAQKKSKKQIKAEAAAAADSIAKLEETLVDGVEMTFKYTDHNFGTVVNGSDISYEFEFVNTGKEDLIISNVSTSCGCTTPEWSKQPIPCKGKGVIKVKYDSSRIGSFSKSITVFSNAKNSPVVLSIKGNVLYQQNNN